MSQSSPAAGCHFRIVWKSSGSASSGIPKSNQHVRRAAGHVTGAEGVEQAVEERGICRAFGRGYPDLGLDAGEVQSRVHGRCHAVEDQFAGLVVQAERLIDGEFVHLRAMAGHFGHGQRADEAAVAETLLHPAVGKPRLEGERREP
jgi:hypothetical protein